jgi:hypothetical protein
MGIGSGSGHLPQRLSNSSALLREAGGGVYV